MHMAYIVRTYIEVSGRSVGRGPSQSALGIWGSFRDRPNPPPNPTSADGRERGNPLGNTAVGLCAGCGTVVSPHPGAAQPLALACGAAQPLVARWCGTAPSPCPLVWHSSSSLPGGGPGETQLSSSGKSLMCKRHQSMPRPKTCCTGNRTPDLPFTSSGSVPLDYCPIQP